MYNDSRVLRVWLRRANAIGDQDSEAPGNRQRSAHQILARSREARAIRCLQSGSLYGGGSRFRDAVLGLAACSDWQRLWLRMGQLSWANGRCSHSGLRTRERSCPAGSGTRSSLQGASLCQSRASRGRDTCGEHSQRRLPPKPSQRSQDALSARAPVRRPQPLRRSRRNAPVSDMSPRAASSPQVFSRLITSGNR
jgi:hypothetical protein